MIGSKGLRNHVLRGALIKSPIEITFTAKANGERRWRTATGARSFLHDQCGQQR